MVNTLRQNYKDFTKKQVDKAALHCKSLLLIGHSSARDVEFLVSSNNIDDFPITIHDEKFSHEFLALILQE